MSTSNNFTAPFILITALLILILFQTVIFTNAEYETTDGGDYITIDNVQYRPDRFFLLAIAANISAFILPAAFYIKLKGAGYSQNLKLALPRPKYLLFGTYMFFVLLSGAVLINSLMLYAGAGEQVNENLLPFVIDAGANPLYEIGIVISFVIVPALCEEFFFRSALAAEYEKQGAVCAAAITSAAFAMAHFSLELFPSYFFAAVVLYIAAKVTGSVFYAVIIHAGYNFFNIYLWDRLSRIINFEQNRVLFMFITAVVFVVFVIFALNSAQYIYYEKALTTPPPKKNAKTKKQPLFIVRFFKSFLSPTFLAAAVIFFIYINIR